MKEPRRLGTGNDLAITGVITLIYAPLLLAYGPYVMNMLGIEQWTAGEIGKFARLVVEAYEK